MMRCAITLSLVIVLASSVSALAQGTTKKEVVTDRRPAVIADLMTAGRAAAKVPQISRPFSDRIGPGNRQLVAAYLMAAHADRAAYAALLKALEAARVDKQVGSPPSSSGGTSMAMKGLAPRIFGFALERGALTREIAGTAVTFRLSPVGVFKALQGSGLVELNDDYASSAVQRFSGRFSLAATFDVSRGADPGVFTGSDQQLSSWAARYTFVNRRDPAAPEYAGQWGELLSDKAAPYQSSVEMLNDALGRWAAYEAWEKELSDTVEKEVDTPFAAKRDVEAAAKTYQKLLTERLKKLETLPLPAEVSTALDVYVAELGKVQSTIDKIYAFVGRGPLLTFDWTTTRDEGLPDLFTWTGIFEAGLGSSRKTDVTFNGAVSLYRSTPTGADQALKSIELTAQLEQPLGNGMPAPFLTFATRYSYLPNNTVTSTGGVVVTTGTAAQGHIVFFQGKLTIPIKDSGMKVPISVTAANRTELIEEKDVRGSIGVTFDMDTLMSTLSGLVR
jgi:hypothetical protein